MSVSFSVVFSATDAAFGETGTWTPTGHAARTATMVFSDLSGEMQTTEGIFVPSADCTAFITKAGTLEPSRGDLIQQGSVSYDIISPPREDATRGQWEVSLKKRL